MLSPAHQAYWADRCLTHYSGPQFRRNIDNPVVMDQPVGSIQTTANPLTNHQAGDWYPACCEDSRLADRLRWATLGYHHDWDTKQYSENRRDPFPDCLGLLARSVLGPLGWPAFTAEAAIVNYYPAGATLSPHTDSSEQNLNHPLLSISLGAI